MPLRVFPSMSPLPRWWLIVVAAAVALVVVLAVALITERDPATTTDASPATPVSTAGAGPTPTRASVPDIVGLHPREARSVLHDAGLEILVHRVSGRRCDATPRVIEQAGHARPRQPVQVWIRVDALSCGLTPMLRDMAGRFIDFARHDADGVPADTPVDLYVGGRIATTIDTYHFDDRTAWQGCPKGVRFWAGRTCPLSAVDPIDDLTSRQGEVRITATAPDLPCGPVQHLPRALDAYGQVAISGGSSCTDSFAITIFVNDVAQIVAADIAWSEP